MKPMGEAPGILEDFLRSNRSGNIMFFSPPRSDVFDCFVEETVKLHEMADDERAACLAVFDAFSAQRVEMFRDKQGNPDRIKVTRAP